MPNVAKLRSLLPSGQTLPYEAWRRRHHAMVALLFAEAILLTAFSFAQGNGWLHSVAHAGGLIPVGVLALALERQRRAASVLGSLGLITACALLVHVWNGAIEAHFLFFITIFVLALYEDWFPFLVAAAYVLAHHGIMGALDPGAVYNHHDAIVHPWKWAAIHAAFVGVAGGVSVIGWRLNETVRAAARASEERFKGAFEGAPIGMALFTFGTGRDGEITQVNRAMCELAGLEQEDLIGTDMRAVVHPEDMPSALEAVASLGEEEQTRQVQVRFVHGDAHVVWVAINLSLLRPESGSPGVAIAQCQDVTESKLAAENLADLVLQDPLTGLGNRRALLADLQARLDRATLESPLLLQLFDLDGFKSYNDTFGHPAGDALLTRMARRLETDLEEVATAYRMGGDEFCVLSLPDRADYDSVAGLALEALTERGDRFHVTASYGSVILPAEAISATEALREADRRMYARKNLDSRSSAGRQSADVLLSILAERNKDLGLHLDQVTDLVEAVADQLELPDEERAPLLQAASLHDVGKAAVPDEILNKPAPLTEEEWAFMRRHTVIGERILSAAPALTRASRLVRWSHERFDGLGYPDGLRGADIPLGSRIIAVCDAYDAMVSDRPYRAAMQPSEALDELSRCAGAQFDPDVVGVLGAALAEREHSGMAGV